MPDDTTKSPMKILIHAIHYPVASARYAADAFKRLGHEVRHVGQETGRQIWGMDVDQKYVWHQGLPEDDWTPDLAILMDTAYQWHYPNENVPTIVWSVDNHVRDLRQPGISHYFLAHRGVSVMEWITSGRQIGDISGLVQFREAIGRPDMTWLPCAYDPTLFTPSPIPYAEREFDVAMIGVMYPARQRLVNELRTAGLKVLAGTGLIYDEYVTAYHNARISLCVSATGDVAQRVFETAAMGCAVVSDDCADFKRLEARGIWQFEDDRDAVALVMKVLDNPTFAQSYIEASLEWVKNETWDNRAQVIIDWLQKRQAGEAFYATAE